MEINIDSSLEVSSHGYVIAENRHKLSSKEKEEGRQEVRSVGLIPDSLDRVSI